MEFIKKELEGTAALSCNSCAFMVYRTGVSRDRRSGDRDCCGNGHHLIY